MISILIKSSIFLTPLFLILFPFNVLTKTSKSIGMRRFQMINIALTPSNFLNNWVKPPNTTGKLCGLFLRRVSINCVLFSLPPTKDHKKDIFHKPTPCRVSLLCLCTYNVLIKTSFHLLLFYQPNKTVESNSDRVYFPKKTASGSSNQALTEAGKGRNDSKLESSGANSDHYLGGVVFGFSKISTVLLSSLALWAIIY